MLILYVFYVLEQIQMQDAHKKPYNIMLSKKSLAFRILRDKFRINPSYNNLNFDAIFFMHLGKNRTHT